MNEVLATLKRLAFYFLLIAINIIPCASVIPDVFPVRNLSNVYLLTLAVCLALYYAHRVSPAGRLSTMMKTLSFMAVLLILLRGVKYSAVAEVGVLARHTWYLYYLPLLMLPQFFFGVSLFVSSKNDAHVSRIWRVTFAVSAILFAAVLTNDLHGQVFVFRPGYANWDNDYAHGWLFYVVTAWQYALYIAAIVVLIVKCRIDRLRKNAWVILIPSAFGVVTFTLLLTGSVPRINGSMIIEFPEAMIFTAAAVLECCMQLGLIPTNSNYGKLFRHFSFSAQITDRNGSTVYASDASFPLTAEQFSLPDGARVGEHTVLHRMPIPGGFGFWMDDMSAQDRLNKELTEAKEGLAEEVALARLQSELKKKNAMIAQRTRMYDTIALRTQRQSQLISELSRSGRTSSDPAFKDACRRSVILLGAYIKRYANLTLLSEEREMIESGELGLSVSEVLRYLNFRGIPGEYIGSDEGALPSNAVLAVFEAFETLLEDNGSFLTGVFVNFSKREPPCFKIAAENLRVPPGEETERRLTEAGVLCDVKTEDNVTYVCLTFPKGGGTS